MFLILFWFWPVDDSFGMQELKTTDDFSRVEPGKTDGRVRQISAAALLSSRLTAGWQMKTGVTAGLFQRRPELLRRTFVWSIKQGTNTLIMWNPRCSVSWKISQWLTGLSCYLLRKQSSHQSNHISGHF